MVQLLEKVNLPQGGHWEPGGLLVDNQSLQRDKASRLGAMSTINLQHVRIESVSTCFDDTVNRRTPGVNDQTEHAE